MRCRLRTLGEAELAVGFEVKDGGGGLGGRPCVVTPPLVGSGFKDVGGGKLRVRRALEVVLEEGKLDFLAIKEALLAAEPDVAEMVSVGARPATVIPRPHDELYVAIWTLRAGRLVGVQGSPEILGIEPASDGEHGGLDVAQELRSGASLPIGIVVGVLGEFIPPGNFVVVVTGIDIRKRLKVEEEAVSIGRVSREVVGPLGGGLGSRLAEDVHEVEHVRQKERAVVMEVVADEPVGDGRLRRDSLERGMRVNGSHGGVEARIGDAPDADASIVVGNVLDEPVDAVIGVTGLVNIAGSFFVRDVGTHVLEGAFAEELSAHVLVDKDVFGAGKEVAGT